jgi:predicted metalloprotease with PDZ domain
MVHTGDEIIAIDGLRVTSYKEINAAIHGSANNPISLTLSREGVLLEVEVIPISHPEHTVKVKGGGNRIWKAIKCSTRRRELLL